MQQQNDRLRNLGRAENEFRAAFDRLKLGQTERLPKGTPVSQNNVAKEAGCDPSALRKSRYPDLVSEIQYWLKSNVPLKATSPRQAILGTRKRNRSLKERLVEMKAQRDHCSSLLLEANAKILDLMAELLKLQAPSTKDNITSIRAGKSENLKSGY